MKTRKTLNMEPGRVVGLSDELVYLLERPLAATTLERYERVYQNYTEFARTRGMSVDDDRSVAEFLVWRSPHVGVPGLKNERSAIRNAARLKRGMPDLGAGEIVTTVINAIQRNMTPSSPQVMQWPIPAKFVSTLLDEVTYEHELLHIRDVALLATAYLGIMRADTVMSLMAGERRMDIVIDSSGVVCVSRVRGAVREKAKGRQLVRDDPRGCGNDSQRMHWAPARYAEVMRMYFEQREMHLSERELRTTMCIWNVGTPDEIDHTNPSASWAAKRVSRAIERLLRGTEEERFGAHYGSHSLRRGGASSCYAVGVEINKIRAIGGWAEKSDNVWLYIDKLQREDEHARRMFGALRTKARRV